MENSNCIEVSRLVKKFDNKIIINNLDLNIANGKVTSILAPSGAGKTTLLRIIAGLDSNFEGKVDFIDSEKNIGFVFQEPSIFEWLTVEQNLQFSIKLKKNRSIFDKNEKDVLIRKVCLDLKISEFLKLYPRQLSGGQKQRVVIGRTLILQNTILLFDEPFSSLDEKTRQDLRELLLSLQKEYSMTILFVTHNVDEALFLADNIFVLSMNPMKVLYHSVIKFASKRDKHLYNSADFLQKKNQIQNLIL